MKPIFTAFLALCFCFFSLKVYSQPYYYTPNVSNIFSMHGCGGCHPNSGGLNISYNGLFTGGSSCGPAVIPFNANGSPLVTKIDPAIPNCSGGNMPPSGSVSAANIAIIKEWINSGALRNNTSSCEDLLISAYMEGSSFNKYLEIYNGTGATIDLSAYSVRIYSNGSTTVSSTIPLSGMLNHNSYLLIAHPSADLAGLTPDITSSNLNFNGNDAVALFNGAFNVDVFGQIGVNPGDTGWANAACFTTDQTWIKSDLGATCIYSAFSGNTDFNPVLSSLYTCFPNNEASAFHTYVECNLPDAIPLPAINYACDPFLIGPKFLEAPRGGIYVYRIYDAPVGGTLINSGLTFYPPALGTYYMALYEPATNCEGERHQFEIILLPSPSVQYLEQNCYISSMTYSLTFSVSGISINSVFDAVMNMPIFLNESNEGIVTNVPFYDNVTLRINDSGCTFYDTFTNSSCTTPPCPTINYPTGTTGMVSVYDGQEFTLSALIVNPLTDLILWSNGQTGNSITLTADNPEFCSVQEITFSAMVSDFPTGCSTPDMLPFNVTVYSDPMESAMLVVNPSDTCSVSVEVCSQVGEYEVNVLGYSINGGSLQLGESYTALAGETSTLSFEIEVTDSENNTSTYTLETELDCPAIIGVDPAFENGSLLSINHVAWSSNSGWEVFYFLPETETGMLDLFVYNSAGSLIYRQEFEALIPGQNSHLLQVPDISSGLYLIQLSGATQTKIYKWPKYH